LGEDGSHEIDYYNWMGWSEAREHSEGIEFDEPEPIKWKHLTNNIRLGGKLRNGQWWHLLQVPTFVELIGLLHSKKS
jgi:hypothetical protein